MANLISNQHCQISVSDDNLKFEGESFCYQIKANQLYFIFKRLKKLLEKTEMPQPIKVIEPVITYSQIIAEPTMAVKQRREKRKNDLSKLERYILKFKTQSM